MDVRVLIRTRSVRACLATAMAVISALIGMQGVAAEGEAEWELRVPVLLYHRISAPPPGAPRPNEWVSPARFRAQLSALRDDGWTTMTAGQLAMALREGTPIGPKRFVIHDRRRGPRRMVTRRSDPRRARDEGDLLRRPRLGAPDWAADPIDARASPRWS